ncbi:MAG: hypothetical protein JWN93_3258 [Hyphomicrobiales bacterium]|nr:hypothetical protein [Hyphomicrobiales bacterium]
MSPTPPTLRAVVVGGGPAGLMAAEVLAAAGASVVVYDRMPSLSRKFLLAGRGGLNLTHSEPLDAFMARYGAAAGPLRAALEAFPPERLRAWAQELGEDTFVGSSGRVFPKSFKASPLLRAWLRRLAGAGVEVRLRHRFAGFERPGVLRFEHEGETVLAEADVAVLALGGASWPRLGSDGGWTGALEALGVEIAPLRAANSGFEAPWSPHMAKVAGAPLKNIAVAFDGRRVRGEAIVTASGLEGGAIYALSGALRDAIEGKGSALLHVDLRPDVDAAALAQRLGERGSQSLANALRKAAGLSPAAANLLREAGPPPSDPKALAARIKAVPVRLTGVRPIARAISSAGGVPFGETDAGYMLRKVPGVFVAGEMLDWEAPTGGYLLQACFSTGFAAAQGAVAYAANIARS